VLPGSWRVETRNSSLWHKRVPLRQLRCHRRRTAHDALQQQGSINCSRARFVCRCLSPHDSERIERNMARVTTGHGKPKRTCRGNTGKQRARPSVPALARPPRDRRPLSRHQPRYCVEQSFKSSQQFLLQSL
jgi:hypothetical protein